MKRWMILLLIIVLAAGIALGIGANKVSVQNQVKEPQPTATSKLSIDPNAGELSKPTPKPTQEPNVSIAGWSRITVPAHSLKAETSLYNPKENEGYYYLTYRLSLKETGEVLFETGLVPPGLSCNLVTLSRELEPGSYPAILHVQPYRMTEDLSPTNNMDLEIILDVE